MEYNDKEILDVVDTINIKFYCDICSAPWFIAPLRPVAWRKQDGSKPVGLFCKGCLPVDERESIELHKESDK
jgi:hypothetical protein